MADLAERYGAWLHVDGAFGLFARVTPEASALAAGVERADSVIADGHKWLNVPYDCGFAFVRDPAPLERRSASPAAYLPGEAELRYRGPEASRRARSLAGLGDACARTAARATARWSSGTSTWPSGSASRVDEAPDLERLAEARSTSSASASARRRADEAELDELNARLGEALLADGRVYVGTTVYGGRVAFRPAIVNWRTREQDVDYFVDVVRELGPPALARVPDVADVAVERLDVVAVGIEQKGGVVRARICPGSRARRSSESRLRRQRDGTGRPRPRGRTEADVQVVRRRRAVDHVHVRERRPLLGLGDARDADRREHGLVEATLSVVTRVPRRGRRSAATSPSLDFHASFSRTSWLT